jgi:hypothetical protein
MITDERFRRPAYRRVGDGLVGGRGSTIGRVILAW